MTFHSLLGLEKDGLETPDMITGVKKPYSGPLLT